MTTGLLADALVEGLVAADLARTQAVTDEALNRGLSAIEVYEHVYRPALYEIGSRWQRGELSVTTEHIATAMTEAEMARLVPGIINPQRRNQTVLVATVEGERHRVGAKMVADCFEAHGWDATHIDGSVPLADLLAFIEHTHPAAIAMSLSVSIHRRNLDRAVAAISERFPSLPLLVGGQGLLHDAPEALPQGPTVHYVPDLMTLESILRRFDENGLDLRTLGATPAAAPALATSLRQLVVEVEQLRRVPPTTIDALDAMSDVLAARVSALLREHPELPTWFGADGLALMDENHRHHIAFMIGWLRHPTPDVLVRTMEWVLASYRSHGFATRYWPAQLLGWQRVFSELLRPDDAAALQPVYQWLIDSTQRIASMQDAERPS